MRKEGGILIVVASPLSALFNHELQAEDLEETHYSWVEDIPNTDHARGSGEALIQSKIARTSKVDVTRLCSACVICPLRSRMALSKLFFSPGVTTQTGFF